MRRFFGSLLFLVLFASPAGASDPVQVAQFFFGELVSLSTIPDLNKREEKVGSLVQDHFAFYPFYKKALLDHWDGWTDSQRREFDHLFQRRFKDHLARHLDRVDRLARQKARYEVRPDGHGRVVVAAKGRVDGDEVTIRIYLVRAAKGWQVYDLDVAGALLSRNYRGRFDYLIQEGGYEGLVEELMTTRPAAS